jgi:hypothetical protein
MVPTGGNELQIGGNTFYDWKNKILMKIPEFKRSGTGIIVEFRGILSGIPNQGGRRSMFLRRRARSIRMRIILILIWLLVVKAHSLCMFVLYCTLLLREKRGLHQLTVPKGTNRVFLWYRFDEYQEIPTKY